MLKRILDSRLPLMVYNPPLVMDTRYFESIHKAGGLPVLDTEFLPPESVQREVEKLESRGILFGLRMQVTDTAFIEMLQTRHFRHLDLVIFSYRQVAELSGFTISGLQSFNIPGCLVDWEIGKNMSLGAETKSRPQMYADKRP